MLNLCTLVIIVLISPLEISMVRQVLQDPRTLVLPIVCFVFVFPLSAKFASPLPIKIGVWFKDHFVSYVHWLLCGSFMCAASRSEGKCNGLVMFSISCHKCPLAGGFR